MIDPTRILIAGIGNIFLGDDAFGVEVAQRLLRRTMPPGVRVWDFGIRGIDLTYALLDGCEVAILVDAVARGGPPGTLYVIEPEPAPAVDPADSMMLIEAHNLDPAKVLQLVSALGGKVQRVVLVGCEPTPFDPEADVDIRISEPVLRAVDEAVILVESLVARILQNVFFDQMQAGGVVEMKGTGSWDA
jgi:hydrogenase maturation protease